MWFVFIKFPRTIKSGQLNSLPILLTAFSLSLNKISNHAFCNRMHSTKMCCAVAGFIVLLVVFVCCLLLFLFECVCKKIRRLPTVSIISHEIYIFDVNYYDYFNLSGCKQLQMLLYKLSVNLSHVCSLLSSAIAYFYVNECFMGLLLDFYS